MKIIMPGFTIHIAVAKEYIRKHKDEIKDEKEFIRGSIAPDYISLNNKNENKNKTHYVEWGDWTSNKQKIHLDEFLNDSKVDIDNDYWKGYFIHLLTDYYFVEVFFEEIKTAKKNKDKFYRDYDCLNRTLLDRYDIKVMEKIKKYMNCIDDNPKYLKIDKVIGFIDEISNISIEEQMKLIQ